MVVQKKENERKKKRERERAKTSCHLRLEVTPVRNGLKPVLARVMNELPPPRLYDHVTSWRQFYRTHTRARTHDPPPLSLRCPPTLATSSRATQGHGAKREGESKYHEVRPESQWGTMRRRRGEKGWRIKLTQTRTWCPSLSLSLSLSLFPSKSLALRTPRFCQHGDLRERARGRV